MNLASQAGLIMISRIWFTALMKSHRLITTATQAGTEESPPRGTFAEICDYSLLLGQQLAFCEYYFLTRCEVYPARPEGKQVAAATGAQNPQKSQREIRLVMQPEPRCANPLMSVSLRIVDPL